MILDDLNDETRSSTFLTKNGIKNPLQRKLNENKNNLEIQNPTAKSNDSSSETEIELETNHISIQKTERPIQFFVQDQDVDECDDEGFIKKKKRKEILHIRAIRGVSKKEIMNKTFKSK